MLYVTLYTHKLHRNREYSYFVEIVEVCFLDIVLGNCVSNKHRGATNDL